MTSAKKWYYEIDVGTLSGIVKAANNNDALRLAEEHANEHVWAAITSGTWILREIKDDD